MGPALLSCGSIQLEVSGFESGDAFVVSVGQYIYLRVNVAQIQAVNNEVDT